MSPYYDQPRHRESEDIAGGLVLLACAVIAFAWYIAVSRLHLHNSQCLEFFLYSAVVLLGGGLIFAQLVGREEGRVRIERVCGTTKVLQNHDGLRKAQPLLCQVRGDDHAITGVVTAAHAPLG